MNIVQARSLVAQLVGLAREFGRIARNVGGGNGEYFRGMAIGHLRAARLIANTAYGLSAFNARQRGTLHGKAGR